jgi:hypothetical protein
VNVGATALSEGSLIAVIPEIVDGAGGLMVSYRCASLIDAETTISSILTPSAAKVGAIGRIARTG